MAARAEPCGIEALRIVHGIGALGGVGQGPETHPAPILGRQLIHQLQQSLVAAMVSG